MGEGWPAHEAVCLLTMCPSAVFVAMIPTGIILTKTATNNQWVNICSQEGYCLQSSHVKVFGRQLQRTATVLIFTTELFGTKLKNHYCKV